MPITDLKKARRGLRAPQPFVKVGVTMAAPGPFRGYTTLFAIGSPEPWPLPGIFPSGVAVVPPFTGMLPRTNPLDGDEARLAKLSVSANQPGVLWLIDILWTTGGGIVIAGSTSVQSLTPPVADMAPRDVNGTSNGEGVLCALVWRQYLSGATAANTTLVYENSQGIAGHSSTITGANPPVTGLFEIFPLAPGDTGVRRPTSIQHSSSRGTAQLNLILFRLVAQVEVTAANVPNAIDSFSSGNPRIFDNSVLQFVWFPTATAPAIIVGRYQETHG